MFSALLRNPMFPKISGKTFANASQENAVRSACILPWQHAAKFAELLGEVLTDSTEKNLAMRVDAEAGATAGRVDIAKRAKALNLDAIHDTVHEIGRDEARHGRAFKGLLDRYFGK